jgi:hypothetical protein
MPHGPGERQEDRAERFDRVAQPSQESSMSREREGSSKTLINTSRKEASARAPQTKHTLENNMAMDESTEENCESPPPRELFSARQVQSAKI